MTQDIIGEPRFELGDIYTTPGATALIKDGLLADLYIDRHWRGDWGDIDAEDRETNNEAIKYGDRILSCFDTPLGRLWIITEADRKHTTVLTPEEY